MFRAKSLFALSVATATLASALIEIPIQKRSVAKKDESVKTRIMADAQMLAAKKAISPANLVDVIDDQITYELGNYKNSQYYGDLFIGSKGEAH